MNKIIDLEIERLSWIIWTVQFSRSVMFDSLWPHGLHCTRPPCPSLSPGVCLSSYPLSRWCYPTSILCHPLLLLPSLFPRIRVFSDESALHIRWPKYWSFSFSISPSNEYSRLVSFRIGWCDLLAVQGTLKSLLQHKYINTLIYLLHPTTSTTPHPSTLAWKIPWTEEPGRLQFMGSRRVGHDWATSLSLFTFLHWRRKWQPTPVFLPGESQGRGSLVGCRLWGRTESDTTEATAAAAGARSPVTLLSLERMVPWTPQYKSIHGSWSLFLLGSAKSHFTSSWVLSILALIFKTIYDASLTYINISVTNLYVRQSWIKNL